MNPRLPDSAFGKERRFDEFDADKVARGGGVAVARDAVVLHVARLALSPIRRRKSSRAGKLAPLQEALKAAPAGPVLEPSRACRGEPDTSAQDLPAATIFESSDQEPG